jgi:predicted O-linked N-acetylglucosamine transferase (SPINDLY family)
MKEQIPILGRASMEHLQKGNLLEAERLLRQILEIDPREINALKLLGFVMAQKNDLNSSIQFLKKVFEINSGDPEILFNLGKAHFDLKEFTESIKFYEKYIAIDPSQVEVLIDIGTAYFLLSNPNTAIKYFDSAIALNPKNSAAYTNKANALNALDKSEEALMLIEQAIALDKHQAISWNTKANIFYKLQNYEKALASARHAIQLNPNLIEAYVNLGNILSSLKQHDEATSIYTEITKLEPNNIQNWIHLGAELADSKRYQESLDAYDRASAINKEYQYLKGNRLHILAMLSNWNIDYIQLNQEARLNKNPEFSSPFPLLSRIDAPEIHLSTSTKFASAHYPKKEVLGEPKKYLHDKIRVGYFSADFRNHPIAFLSAELYELHSRDQFEIYGFYYGPKCNDEMYQRISRSFDHFIEVQTLGDLEIAKLSRELEIDIAVDLGGYTQDARLGIFSYRAAPVQISYLGYLGTSGTEYIDYLITDNIITPEGSDIYYSEKLVRLPSYQVNDRKRQVSNAAFTKADLGIPEDAFVFCCLNNNYKFTPEIFTTWLKILHEVEGSVILLFSENQTASSNLIKFSVANGVDPKRIFFAKKLSYADYLARYQVANLFLDSFPYNAGTTASDALWSGLPVLTLAGKSFASRVAASLLTAIGLPELITHSEQEYLAKAIDLAQNPETLKELKKILATNRHSTPLFDSALFTKNLECAYIQIHNRYKEGLSSQGITIN